MRRTEAGPAGRLLRPDNDASSAGTPYATTLDALRLLVNSQTGPNSEPLNLRVRYLLGPADFESTFSILRSAETPFDPADPSTSRLTTFTDQRLNGGTVWYGLCDPQICAGIELLYPEGNPGGLRFERVNVMADGIYFRYGVDCAAVLSNWRAVARNAGA